MSCTAAKPRAEMATNVAQINERWKKGCLLAFVAALWLFHVTTATWFVAHCETTEAEVSGRKEWLLPGKRHGWAKLEVAYVDGRGRRVTDSIEWHVTPPPPGRKIEIWRADTGVIKAGPASLAEAFFIETMFAALALLIGIMIGAAILYGKLKARIKKRLARKS